MYQCHAIKFDIVFINICMYYYEKYCIIIIVIIMIKLNIELIHLVIKISILKIKFSILNILPQYNVNIYLYSTLYYI